MGNKVNPIGARIGITKGWNGSWFCNEDYYSKKISSDLVIRNFIEKKLEGIVFTNIYIERVLNNITIYIECPDPGVVIGKNGENIKSLNDALKKTFNEDISVNILETKNKPLNAKIIVSSIAEKINSRIPYKKAIKQNMETAMSARAEGIKVIISGRLGGAEIAREECYLLGKISNHTLKSDIDYCFGTAETVYGTIGIKVWISKGEVVLNNMPLMSIKKIAENKPKNFKNYDFKNNKNFKKAN